MELREYLKSKRKMSGMTQEDLSSKAGVGLRLVREIEQGKTSMRMDKVNQILDLFGSKLGVVSKQNRDD
jgi:y4mF family transcriptional regulator